MARTKINKSQAIRDYLEKNSAASAKEVVEALAREGIKVNSQLVYGLKARAKNTRRAGRKPRARANGNMADFFAVLDLARKIGVENLREIANRLPE